MLIQEQPNANGAQHKAWPITPGIWEASTNRVEGVDVIGVNAFDAKGKVLAITGNQLAADEAVSIGNAFLIAEAGTVYNECLIRPRQLLERLLAAESRALELESKAAPAGMSPGFIAGHPLGGEETRLQPKPLPACPFCSSSHVRAEAWEIGASDTYTAVAECMHCRVMIERELRPSAAAALARRAL